MPAPYLRIFLVEGGFTETGATLRTLCEETSREFQLFPFSKRAGLFEAMLQCQPHVALIDLSLLRPDT